MQYRYVFGPVVSGRLGRSLGLDLLGAKICSYDCLYCEVGPSRRTTLTRRPYVPADTLLKELEQWKRQDMVPLDHVTLGGSGEPCLNTDMKEIIFGARELFPETRIAVLTNTSLVHLEEVAVDLSLADVVMPSMDSVVPAEFQALNQPHADVELPEVMQGLLAFRKRFIGVLAMEVLLSRGVNDSEANLHGLSEYVKRLAPDRVDVTTLSRPGAYDAARAVDQETLDHWNGVLNRACGCTPGMKGLGGSARGLAPGPGPVQDGQDLKEALLASLKRRPQTGMDLAMALGADPGSVDQALDELVSCDMLRRELLESEDNPQVFYRVVSGR